MLATLGQLERRIDSGWTTVCLRGRGVGWEVVDAKRAVSGGVVPGPRVFAAPHVLSTSAGHSLAELVDREVRNGADWICLEVNGEPTVDMSGAAYGRPMIASVATSAEIASAARWGPSAIELWAPVDDAVIAQLRESGVPGILRGRAISDDLPLGAHLCLAADSLPTGSLRVEELIRSVTSTPASALGLTGVGSIRPGAPGDLVGFRMESGEIDVCAVVFVAQGGRVRTSWRASPELDAALSQFDADCDSPFVQPPRHDPKPSYACLMERTGLGDSSGVLN